MKTYIGIDLGGTNVSVAKITEDGKIAAGDEASKSWTIPVDKRWVVENTHIYALALDQNGYVNNMNVCTLDGGDSGYDLK